MQAENAFSDGFPLLVVNQARWTTSTPGSLPRGGRRDDAALSAQSRAQRPAALRRRPHRQLDIETDEGQVRLRLVKPCVRCSIPNVDPAARRSPANRARRWPASGPMRACTAASPSASTPSSLAARASACAAARASPRAGVSRDAPVPAPGCSRWWWRSGARPGTPSSTSCSTAARSSAWACALAWPVAWCWPGRPGAATRCVYRCAPTACWPCRACSCIRCPTCACTTPNGTSLRAWWRWATRLRRCWPGLEPGRCGARR
jgi:hypothetical protein